MTIQTLIPLGAPIMAAGAFAIGTVATLKPTWMSGNYGIPAEWPHAGFVVGLGLRDIFMGVALLFSWYQQDWHSLAVWSTMLFVVAVGDFVIVLKAGNKKASVTHLLGASACLVYTVLLTVFLVI